MNLHFIIATAIAIALSTILAASPTPFLSERKEAWSPEKQKQHFKLADDFVIELVASEENGLINPIDLTFDDAGRLWTQTARMYPLDPVVGVNFVQAMKMMKDHDAMAKDPRFAKIKRLYTLEDKGKDQILIIDSPNKQATGPLKVWADGLTIPQSIMPYKNGCYVAHGSELFYLSDENDDEKQDKMTPVLSGFGFFDTHTMAHSIVRGPGGWMHFTQGAITSGFVKTVKTGKVQEVAYSKNMRFSIDGKHMEIINCHRDNNWGYQIKSNGHWYATAANDGGYSILPTEPMMSIAGLGNEKLRSYQPFFPPSIPFRVGGTGISGLAFSEDGEYGFPKGWNNVAILANPITHSLNCVHITRTADGRVIAKHLPDLLQCSDDWFRPVNIEFGPDGCLYIADWYNKVVSHNDISTDHPDRDKKHGRIWRIRHKSQRVSPIPNVSKSSSKDLLHHLSKGKTLWEKRAAWHQIVDRNAQDLAPQLQQILCSPETSKEVAILALWSLEGLNCFHPQIHQQAIQHVDHDVKREAIRSLASFKGPHAPSLTTISKWLAPLITSKHCMVRSQVLKTLEEIDRANTSTISILVSACKPAAPNNQLGGNYERNFERYLARKALERYPTQLYAFLSSQAAKIHPNENILWALQALPEKDKVKVFLKKWQNSANGKIDKDTLVSVSEMLVYPAVKEALQTTFDQRSDELLQLTLKFHTEIDTAKIARFYKANIENDLKSGNKQRISKALETLIKLRSPHHTNSLLQIIIDKELSSLANLAIQALLLDPTFDKQQYRNIFFQQNLGFSAKLSACAAWCLINHSVARNDVAKWLPKLNQSDTKSLVSRLSHTHQGVQVLLHLWEISLIKTEHWDYDATFRANALTRNDWRVKQLFDHTKGIKKTADQIRRQRVAHYTRTIAKLKGNPTTGKAFFQSCLTCHKVGDKGISLGPPLDGSANRDLQHLLTAIICPDDAVEGTYGLFSVVKKDGSEVSGIRKKSDNKGTIIATAGGAETFIAQEHILHQRGVNIRSFMTTGFGDLPDQAMADLVSYIKTLK